MLHRARSAPGHGAGARAAGVPVPVPQNETEWLKLLEENDRRSEESSKSRRPTTVSQAAQQAEDSREPTPGKRKRRRDGQADPRPEARPASRWRQPAAPRGRAELSSRVASANAILNEAADMINAKLRTLRSLKAANDSLDAARVEAQAVAAKATADLREAWACNAVWYGRALAAEKQLNPSPAPAAAPAAATLDSVGSRCGYDRLASMMGTVSAENSSLRTQLSNASAAKDQAVAAVATALQDRDAAVAQVEALKRQIVNLTAKSEAAETERESLERDARKRLEAARKQLAGSANIHLRAQVDASKARTAADASENERLETAQAPRLLQPPSMRVRQQSPQPQPVTTQPAHVKMQTLARLQHDQQQRGRPQGDYVQGYYREFRELQAILPAGVNVGEDFKVQIPGVPEMITVAFPPDAVAGAVYTFRLEGERQLQQWVGAPVTPTPTLKVEHAGPAPQRQQQDLEGGLRVSAIGEELPSQPTRVQLPSQPTVVQRGGLASQKSHVTWT